MNPLIPYQTAKTLDISMNVGKRIAYDKVEIIINEMLLAEKKRAEENKHHFASYQYFGTRISLLKSLKNKVIKLKCEAKNGTFRTKK